MVSLGEGYMGVYFTILAALFVINFENFSNKNLKIHVYPDSTLLQPPSSKPPSSLASITKLLLVGFPTSPFAPFYSLLSAQKQSDRLYHSSAQCPSLAPHFSYILTIMIYKDQCLLFPHLYTLACPLLKSSIALFT